MDLMTPESGTIVWTAVIFLLLMLVLYKIAWKPILAMLEEREHMITESLKAAEQAHRDAEKSSEKHRQIIEEATKEAQKIILEARRTAEKMNDEMSQRAQLEAEQIIERAQKELDAGRDKILQEMRDLAVELSMAATENLIAQKLSKEDHQAAVNEALKKIENLS